MRRGGGNEKDRIIMGTYQIVVATVFVHGRAGIAIVRHAKRIERRHGGHT